MSQDKDDEMSEEEADELLKTPGMVIEPFEPKRKSICERIKSIFHKEEDDVDESS